MRIILLVGIFCLGGLVAFCQTNGDYRTRSAGYWNQPARWEVFNGAWVALDNVAAGPFLNVIPSNASGVIAIRHNVTIAASININQTVIESPAQMIINGGVTVRLVDDLVSTPLQINSGAVLANFGVLDLQTLLTTTPCLVSGQIYSTGPISISNSSLLVFNSGSRYIHAHSSGGTVPSSTWDPNSICIISGLNRASPAAPGNLGQSFGHFAWDTPSMGSVGFFSLAGALTNVNGNLILASTGGRTIWLGAGGAGYSLNIGGDLIVQTGSFIFSQAQTSATTITVGGDFNMISGSLSLGNLNNYPIDIFLGGNFQKSGGNLVRGSGLGAGTFHFDGASVHTYTNNAALVTAVSFSVRTGSTLDLGTTALTGTGNFTLFTGGTINVGSTDAGGAIQLGTGGGNIRVSGTRIYQTGSTIVYNGNSTQFMSSGHPSTPNTTIDNNDSVYMLANVTINGLLHLNTPLIIDNNTLTLGGTITYGAGFLGITTLSNVTVNGTGAFGDLVLAPVQTQSPPNAMNNLTINRSGGTVNLGLSVIVGGTFTHTNGTFIIGQAPGWSLTLRGAFSQGAGASISLTDNPIFIVEGSGAMPANINFTGTGFEQLTMNRAGSTFNTTSAVTIQSLNLFNGIVNHASSNLTMLTDGVVTRTDGTINQLLGAQSTYHVIYDVTTSISTGNELPTVATRLDNLTKLGSGSVTLDRDIVVNGDFALTAGLFDVGTGNNLEIKGNFIVDGTFEGQQGLVSFSGGAPQIISGASSLTFYDVAVDQTASSTVTLSTNVAVENSLAVNSVSTVNAGNQLLTLLSNATATAYVPQLNAGAAIEGTVIAQRFLPNAAGIRNWRFITPVVENSFVSDWKTELTITGTFSDPATGPGVISTNPSMYIWDETFVSGGTNRYRPYPTSGLSSAAPLVQGRGYSVFGRTEGEITFDSRGRLGQGQVDVNVTNSGGTDPGWNLIGNPYPAPIDWDLVAAALPGNVENAVYITDANDNGGVGGNVYYSAGVSIPASWQGIIAPGQAFFVRANGNATISFQESHKFAGQTQFFREETIQNVLRISIQGSGFSDELALRLHENATDLFDRNFDALKFFDAPLSISTRTPDNQKLSINAINSLSCGQAIPMVIETASQGSFTLKFSGVETFENGIAMRLRDKQADKLIDLSSTSEYVFSTTDVASLNDRFEIIIDGKGIDTMLDVAGESVCENGSWAYVKVFNSQQNVNYNLQWNGQNVSTEVSGSGMDILLPINVALLPQGEQQLTIFASSKSCSGTELAKKAIIKIDNAVNITSINHGSVCGEGSAKLTVSGSSGASYNWYENEDDNTPIATSSTGTFETPVLSKSKTYYATAVNAMGCESERLAVKATVSYIEPAAIEQNGFMLVSNHDEGNQWFLDGMKLDNATEKRFEMQNSGNYTLLVTKGGCTSTTLVNVTLDSEFYSENSIVVYPNPTVDKVTVEVKSAGGVPSVKVVSSAGVELNTVDLQMNNNKHVGELDLVAYPQGVYLIQINDGKKTFIRKISKL